MKFLIKNVIFTVMLFYFPYRKCCMAFRRASDLRRFPWRRSSRGRLPRWCPRRTRNPRATTTWPFPTPTPSGRRACPRRQWWSGPSPGWAPLRPDGAGRSGTRTPTSWIQMIRRSGSRRQIVRVRVFSRCNATISMRVLFSPLSFVLFSPLSPVRLVLIFRISTLRIRPPSASLRP